MAKRGGMCCGFPGRWNFLSGLFLQFPRVAFPLPCVYTYLCLSLMSTGLHTEPYRVSCHCRRTPAWKVSFPRAASEPHPAGHENSRGPSRPTTWSAAVVCVPLTPGFCRCVSWGALRDGKGRLKGGTPKQSCFAFTSLSFWGFN